MASHEPAPVRAVLFDLDDTLYPQARWLDGAWASVAAVAGDQGVAPAPLADALRRMAAQGSDRGAIIDRALEAVGATDVDVAPLVEAFRHHASPPLTCFPGVVDGLRRLRARVPVGLITDGDPATQRDKLRATGLHDAFDVVVLSDELGREHRKPDPLPFRTALQSLELPPSEVVYVGDRPEKDVVGGTAVGLRVVRVRTGEYADHPDHPDTWRHADDAAGAIAMLEEVVASA